MQNNSISQLAPITLGDLWNTVLRRFWVVALIMAAMIAFGIIYLKVTPRVYEAEAVILLDTQEKNVDVRIISATHKKLSHCVETGQFRQDLYYRLRGVTINLPPLRERAEDIPELAHYLMFRFNQQFFWKI